MADESRREDASRDEIAAGAASNVMQYLKGIDFPATRDEVESQARQNGADESALDEIRMLPQDRKFDDPAALIKAIGDETRNL